MTNAEDVGNELFEDSTIGSLKAKLEDLNETIKDLEKKWVRSTSKEKKLIRQSGKSLLKKEKLQDLSQSSMSEIIVQLVDVFRNPQVERARDFVKKILHKSRAKLRQATMEDILRGIAEIEEETLKELTELLQRIEKELGNRDMSLVRAFGRLIEKRPSILLERQVLEGEWSQFSGLDDSVEEILTVWRKHGYLPGNIPQDICRRPSFYFEERVAETVDDLRKRSDSLVEGLDSIKKLSAELFRESSKRIKTSLTRKSKTLRDLLERLDSVSEEVAEVEKHLDSFRPIAAFLDNNLKGKGVSSGSSRLDSMTKELTSRIKKTKGFRGLSNAVQRYNSDFARFAERLNDEFQDLHSWVEDSLETFGEEQEVKRIRSKGIPSYEPDLFREDTLKAIKKLNQLRDIRGKLENLLLKKWSPGAVEVYRNIQEHNEVPYDPKKSKEIEEISSTVPLMLKKKGT